MMSDEFKAIKEGAFGAFYDYSRNHTMDDIMQRLFNENMTENAEEIIKYIRNYGFFEFERTESKSRDIIKFYSNPLSLDNPYWEEFKNKVAYIGGFRNSSCVNSWIEKFYMLPNCSFYNQDKKKIADNSKDFFNYITTVEYDYHSSILESTYKRLKDAGWYENRKINISDLITECEKNEVCLTESQKHFIEEFGGIKGDTEENYNKYFFISDRRDSPFSNGEPVYFVNIMKDESLSNQLDEEDIIEVSEKYGKNTVYVGNCQYYSNPILLSESGNMLLVSCGDVKPLGRTAIEGFNVLLGYE